MWKRQTGNRPNEKIHQTEKSVSEQLPGDVFQLDSTALSHAASFGLVAMEEGWIAGGIIAKVIRARLRKNPALEALLSEQRAEKSDAAWCKSLAVHPVDPTQSAKSLVRLRTSLVMKGLIR